MYFALACVRIVMAWLSRVIKLQNDELILDYCGTFLSYVPVV